MTNRLSVKLDGQEYTIVSEESREYMLEISDLVNKKLTDVKIQNSRLSSAMAAMLVALNMADDMKKSGRAYEERIAELTAENNELKKKVEAARNFVQSRNVATPVANTQPRPQTPPYKK